MGTYGYTAIDIEYNDKSSDKERKAFIKEIKDEEKLNAEVKGETYIKISSGRLLNLTYQEGLFKDIAKKHKCVLSLNGSSFIEADCDIYFDRAEEEQNDNEVF